MVAQKVRPKSKHCLENLKVKSWKAKQNDADRETNCKLSRLIILSSSWFIAIKSKTDGETTSLGSQIH